MSMFSTPSITQIRTTREELFAFEITGTVSKQDLEAMAEFMNAAFNEHYEVDMLLIFEDFRGSAISSMFSAEVMKAQWRSLSNVGNYVVVGAPAAAETPIRTMGSLLPVKTRTFERSEVEKAWRFLNAEPVRQ